MTAAGSHPFAVPEGAAHPQTGPRHGAWYGTDDPAGQAPVPPGIAPRAPTGPGIAPPAPTGPGVAPPFAAPPVDRSQRGLWIGLTVGALALVLCCAGGLFGFGLLVVAGTDQAEREARQAVDRFVAALKEQDYEAALGQMCDAFVRRSSAETIEVEFGGHEITGHRVGNLQVGNTRATADVEIQYADQVARRYRFTLVAEDNRLKVCGWQ
jgi:hypothetical protein